MAITGKMRSDPGVVNFASGSFFDDGTIKKTVLNLGFVPRYVRLVNETDRDAWEWFEGSAAGTTLKTVAAGTVTLDTTDVAITVGTLDTGAVDTWQVYEQTTTTVGVPGTAAAESTSSTRLNKATERITGAWFPAAFLEASKQYRWQAIG